MAEWQINRLVSLTVSTGAGLIPGFVTRASTIAFLITGARPGAGACHGGPDPRPDLRPDLVKRMMLNLSGSQWLLPWPLMCKNNIYKYVTCNYYTLTIENKHPVIIPALVFSCLYSFFKMINDVKLGLTPFILKHIWFPLDIL